MSCLIITLNKCLKGHKSLGLLLGSVLEMYCEFCFRILALSSHSVRPLSSSVTSAFMPVCIQILSIDSSIYHVLMTRPDQTRPDQTRPDQTRPDQTRPDQTRPDQT